MDVTRATQESEGFDDRDGIRNGVADQFVKFGGGVLEYPHLPQQRLTLAVANVTASSQGIQVGRNRPFQSRLLPGYITGGC